jgi:hypothetical protein
MGFGGNVAATVDLHQALSGRGFERIEHVDGSSYRDNSTIIVCPTRGIRATVDADGSQMIMPGQREERWVTVPAIHQTVVGSWQNLIAPMNQKRAFLFATGHEVGEAYNAMIGGIIGNPDLAKWKYVLTVEDDNVLPPDAHIRLLETINTGRWDVVAGLYFTKGELQMPMAYGCPDEFARTGILDFRPRDVRDALAAGQVMPVNGVAMGCTLYRMELFRELAPPWFVTVSDWSADQGGKCFTQDLYFCERAVRAGKRFAVDMRVRVGHLDVETGIVY